MAYFSKYGYFPVPKAIYCQIMSTKNPIVNIINNGIYR